MAKNIIIGVVLALLAAGGAFLYMNGRRAPAVTPPPSSAGDEAAVRAVVADFKHHISADIQKFWHDNPDAVPTASTVAITQVALSSDGSYDVQGTIGIAGGGTAPVTIKVRSEAGQWVITGFSWVAFSQ